MCLGDRGRRKEEFKSRRNIWENGGRKIVTQKTDEGKEGGD
jgi:hypothetical protein